MPSMTDPGDSGPPANPPDPPPPPPDPPGRAVPRLVRSTDRYAGGVAGGIALVLDVDPILVRVALVVGTLYVPLVVVAYALAWLVLPDERTGATLLGAARTSDGWRPVAGVAGLGVGLALLAPELGPGGNGALTAGVLLAGLGVLLVLHHPDPTAPSVPAPPLDLPPEAWPDPPLDELDEPDAPDAPDGPPPARHRPSVAPLERFVRRRVEERRRTRPPSHLGWLGLSALVVLVGLVAAFDRAIAPMKPGVAVSLGLLLVGGLLSVAAWRGRARLLILPGIVLLPALVGWGLTDVPRYDHDGDVTYLVTSRDELRRSYEHGFGRLEVDMHAVELRPGEHRTVHVGLTAGDARLLVPPEAHLVVRGDVGFGDVEIDEQPYYGRIADSGKVVAGEVDLRAGDPQPSCTEQPVYGPDEYDEMGNFLPPEVIGTETLTPWGEPCEPEPPPDDPPELEIVLDVGIGKVVVERAAA
jgi:phage shock protein PspC (stress-responsive transcriptional regulator)